MKILKINEYNSDLTYNDFKEKINNFLDTNKEIHGSFAHGHYFERDYLNHIKKLNNFLNGELDYYMDKYYNKIFNDNFFIESCGFLDTLLYHYDNSYYLSGMGFDDSNNDGGEYMIKYHYGYQKYDLGKKYLEQNFGTLENFYAECAKNFAKIISEAGYMQILDPNSFSKVINTDVFVCGTHNNDEYFYDYLKENKFKFDYIKELNTYIIYFGIKTHYSLKEITKYAEDIKMYNKIKKYNI
ncbi:hypothetical protein M0Q97_08260 [Candidatus Dojkabacteria bacterium]|jgi:hypothetical protein|nr:hypothetical protein [Candidatus Dojkabacteria bacterium]